MFVVYYKSKKGPIRYFHPEKGLQKTIKTVWVLPESVRKDFEKMGLKTKTVNVSPVAEIMYPNGVQKNKIQW